jgi:hypothetical protein
MRHVEAVLMVASMLLLGLIGFVMVTRPRFFVARYVKTTTAQAPRRERPTQDDLAKVKPGCCLLAVLRLHVVGLCGLLLREGGPGPAPRNVTAKCR